MKKSRLRKQVNSKIGASSYYYLVMKNDLCLRSSVVANKVCIGVYDNIKSGYDSIFYLNKRQANFLISYLQRALSELKERDGEY